jgi:tetratricopeptide (TPR) repeat protein
MAEKKPKQPRKSKKPASQQAAEIAYAQGVMHHTLGNRAESIASLEKALSLKPDYAPAVLTMASIEYQRQQQEDGKKRLFSLLKLSSDTEDIVPIIDEAGSVLISINEFSDGLELYREAAKRFPYVPAFRQGIACCAGQEGLFDEALEAVRRAIELDPENVAYVNDMGWTLVLAERFREAEAAFKQALEIDPSNERAQMNLQYCQEQLSYEPALQPEPHATIPKKRKAKRD